MSWYRWEDGKLCLSVRVQPRSSRDEFSRPVGHRIRIRITAPPLDGRANEHLRRFLARAFGVSRSDVRLVRGDKGRDKEISIFKPKKIPPELESELSSARADQSPGD